MKRVVVFASASAIAGFLLGDIMHANGAEERDAKALLAAKEQESASRAKARRVTGHTSELAPRDSEDGAADENDIYLPPEIRRARELGAKAREKAVKEMIYNEAHGLVAKDRGWGMGGHTSRLVRTSFTFNRANGPFA